MPLPGVKKTALKAVGLDAIAGFETTNDALNVTRAEVQPRPDYSPRIALLTPYTGGNLGDAAIQDSIIANLRVRLPGARFSGISLNCDNFVEQHGDSAFSLCGRDIPFYSRCSGTVAQREQKGQIGPSSVRTTINLTNIKSALKRIPIAGWCLRAVYIFWRELSHSINGYRFLCSHDLLLVSGGGQLNEQCGGPWGQPYALFKWALLAQLAGVPYAIASVGLGAASSKTSRLFLALALRLAKYRSYRDQNTKTFASALLPCASTDSVVPDFALSLPPSKMPRPAGIRSLAGGRPVIAISLIVYAKPAFWPSTWLQNRELYQRYTGQMAEVVSELLKRGYFLLFVSSSLGDDDGVKIELLERLDEDSRKRLGRQTYTPAITKWADLVSLLRDVDVLIASRLHSAILSFVAQTPTIAISYDRKVDWVMEDLGQTEYVLQIGDFVAADVFRTLNRVELQRGDAVGHITSYVHRSLPKFARQYDCLARLAQAARH